MVDLAGFSAYLLRSWSLQGDLGLSVSWAAAFLRPGMPKRCSIEWSASSGIKLRTRASVDTAELSSSLPDLSHGNCHAQPAPSCSKHDNLAPAVT